MRYKSGSFQHPRTRTCKQTKEAMERLSILLQLLVFYQVFFLAKASHTVVVESDWGEWSPCSRTCGPAISTQERNCLNKTCDGPTKQFRSCLNVPCAESVDLRAELCATLSGDNHTYTPLNVQSQCLLTCKAIGKDGEMIVRGPLEVLDGTHCTTVTGQDGLCVDAMCAPVGCDGVLGSKKAVDKCGRCIGPGAYGDVCTRTLVTVTEAPTAGPRHVQMAEIPVGASSITVTNLLPPQQASLMVRSGLGEYLFTVGPSGSKFRALGTEFTYNVAVLEGNYTESLTTSDTLNQSITIEVYIPSGEIVPSITYEYYTLEGYTGVWGAEGPLVSTLSSIDWVYGPILPCSNTCATGIQTAYAMCKDLEYGRLLPDSYCNAENKSTPILRFCGSEDCTPRWDSSEWWPCSGSSCGTGSQERLVRCLVLEASGRDRMVEDAMCNATIRPAHERECVLTENSGCDSVWEVEEWGECCSRAPLERRVECVDTSGHTQPPVLCSHLPRNASIQLCKKDNCGANGCLWVPKRWFKCNNTCGHGFQRRNVLCRKSDGRLGNGYCCRDQPLPEQLRECYDDRSSRCEPQWHNSSWGQCTGNCGENRGERHRRVECRARNRHNIFVQFPDQFCSNQTRPEEVGTCTREDPLCSGCEWGTGAWSECYCPLGIRLRTVVCSSGSDDCCLQRGLYRPPGQESCGCSPPEPDPLPSPLTTPPTECVDDHAVNCTQIKVLGHCTDNDTTFFVIHCCQTCSSLR